MYRKKNVVMLELKFRVLKLKTKGFMKQKPQIFKKMIENNQTKLYEMKFVFKKH